MACPCNAGCIIETEVAGQHYPLGKVWCWSSLELGPKPYDQTCPISRWTDRPLDYTFSLRLQPETLRMAGRRRIGREIMRQPPSGRAVKPGRSFGETRAENESRVGGP
jgi:hypothetical protein